MIKKIASWALLEKALRNLSWLPAYWVQSSRRKSPLTPFHLILAVANHFEPYINPANPGTFVPRAEQLRRVRDWCSLYQRSFESVADNSGSPFRHTYFFPAEHGDAEILDMLAKHCHLGWGEIEIHLHHGVRAPDTPENTRAILTSFRDFLAGMGCLCKLNGVGQPRYAFVHGNWALANSANGEYCGVDCEMQILAETGCYADLTLPSAPGRGQVAKINSLYECSRPLQKRAPHRRGHNLSSGVSPRVFPLIIQGPLMLDWKQRRFQICPAIDNSAITAANPPSLHRLQLWTEASIGVIGCPDWVFVKLHCHGMDPRDSQALLGSPMLTFLNNLSDLERNEQLITHFVTAREMTNIALAACRGATGNPSCFRGSPLVPLSKQQ